jgi:hypothetical protein
VAAVRCHAGIFSTLRWVMTHNNIDSPRAGSRRAAGRVIRNRDAVNQAPLQVRIFVEAGPIASFRAKQRCSRRCGSQPGSDRGGSHLWEDLYASMVDRRESHRPELDRDPRGSPGGGSCLVGAIQEDLHRCNRLRPGSALEVREQDALTISGGIRSDSPWQARSRWVHR